MSKAEQILGSAAMRIANRAKKYDAPNGERSARVAARAFTELTGRTLTEQDAWLFLVLLKAARIRAQAGAADSTAIDGAALFALLGESKHAKGDAPADEDKADAMAEPQPFDTEGFWKYFHEFWQTEAVPPYLRTILDEFEARVRIMAPGRWYAPEFGDKLANLHSLIREAFDCNSAVEFEKVTNRFHQLWTADVGRPDYDKPAWKDFERMLLKARYKTNPPSSRMNPGVGRPGPCRPPETETLTPDDTPVHSDAKVRQLCDDVRRKERKRVISIIEAEAGSGCSISLAVKDKIVALVMNGLS